MFAEVIVGTVGTLSLAYHNDMILSIFEDSFAEKWGYKVKQPIMLQFDDSERESNTFY